MKIGTNVWIEPGDAVECSYVDEIAKIRVGGALVPRLTQLLSYQFTPRMAKAWLTDYARQIQLLAASIPVNDEPDDEPDAQVRSILGGAIA